MARESRLRRNLPIDIDLQVLQRIAVAARANHKQYRNAYSRALKRTAVTVRKRAVEVMKTGIEPRSAAIIRRRLLSFRLTRNGGLDEAKVWFGLNAIKVKDLKGKVKGRLRRHHDRRDPNTGRFIEARKRRSTAAVGFEPKGALLSAKTFTDGEIARSKRENRRTIVIRDPQTRRAKEAEIDIYAPVLDHIEDYVFSDVADIFFHHFETDLKGRIKARINV
ncbi:hypothetical protein [Serratia sp. P2ACOL2]|uniref:hypothetical protein n=1 Tax=Serratia sp. P2ACOL2 TaxID=2482769 RepID=UPI000EFD6F6E|nr:hypothetical protein [Serratia sp. P2ACOL2]AYO37226.1 hypothetical protein EBA31_07910 [Serratia sp. P2ACOL2]